MNVTPSVTEVGTLDDKKIIDDKRNNRYSVRSVTPRKRPVYAHKIINSKKDL